MFSSHTNPGGVSPFRQQWDKCLQEDQQASRLAVVFRELYHLLEDYAPQWYTLEHHQRSELGLRKGGQEQADAFLMLYNLLQEYAPPWYTQEHHKRARLTLQNLGNL
jgi:hypothetical protein